MKEATLPAPTTMLYRFPGATQLQDGAYDCEVVLDEEVEAKIAEGWHKTPAEAKAEGDAKKAAAEKDAAADADAKKLADARALIAGSEGAPSRAELEQKATELGIKFDGRVGDKKLAALIAEALKA